MINNKQKIFFALLYNNTYLAGQLKIKLLISINFLRYIRNESSVHIERKL